MPISLDDATRANAACNAAIEQLLTQEGTNLSEILARPNGLARVLQVAGAHLTRPASEVHFIKGEPLLGEREHAFYRACEDEGIEIPFRTKRQLTAEEKTQEETWRKQESRKRVEASHARILPRTERPVSM